MKRIIIILAIVFVFACPIQALASEGAIRVELPENMSGVMVTYKKDGGAEQFVYTDENGIADIENLEEGIYQIEVQNTAEYTFMSSEVSIPMWSEENSNMMYHVTVIPKYSKEKTPVTTEEIETPATGDKGPYKQYAALAAISLIIVLIMSCHNRFKCGRMSDKYSKTRRI